MLLVGFQKRISSGLKEPLKQSTYSQRHAPNLMFIKF